MTTQKTTQRKSKTVVAKPSKRVELPPNPFVHEILDHIGKQRSRIAKIEALKEYRNPALVSILIWNFDDTVISLIPEGPVPFKPNDVPEGTDHTSPLTAGTGITTGTGTVYKSWKEQMVAEFTPAFLLTLLVCRQKDR